MERFLFLVWLALECFPAALTPIRGSPQLMSVSLGLMLACPVTHPKYPALILVAAVCFLLQGCPPVGTTEILNDTGQPITVRWADKGVAVSTGSSARIRPALLPETFQIETPKEVWRYENVYPPPVYLEPDFGYGLRVERDGRLYAFQLPDATKKISGQPPGFPLRPKT